MLSICSNLGSFGYKTSIIYPDHEFGNMPLYNTRSHVDHIRIGSPKRNKILRLVNYLKVIIWINMNTSKEDTIVYSDPIVSILSFLILRSKKVRYIQADDYTLFDDLHLLENKFFLKSYKLCTMLSFKYNSNQFIFNSKFSYINFTNISKKELQLNLVHPGVDRSIFKPKNRKQAKEEKPNVCTIARSHPLKGLQDFLIAIQSIDRSLYNEVYIITNDDLKDFDIEMFNIISPKSDYDIAHILNKCEIFISTSYKEGFGLPPLEAMSCGCAVIASDSGGINEFCINGKNCLLFNPGDTNELTFLLNKLIENRILIDKISKEGLITSESFSWERTCNQFHKAINES